MMPVFAGPIGYTHLEYLAVVIRSTAAKIGCERREGESSGSRDDGPAQSFDQGPCHLWEVAHMLLS